MRPPVLKESLQTCPTTGLDRVCRTRTTAPGIRTLRALRDLVLVSMEIVHPLRGYRGIPFRMLCSGYQSPFSSEGNGLSWSKDRYRDICCPFNNVLERQGILPDDRPGVIVDGDDQRGADVLGGDHRLFRGHGKAPADGEEGDIRMVEFSYQPHVGEQCSIPGMVYTFIVHDYDEAR